MREADEVSFLYTGTTEYAGTTCKMKGVSGTCLHDVCNCEVLSELYDKSVTVQLQKQIIDVRKQTRNVKLLSQTSEIISREPRPGECTKSARMVRVMTGNRGRGGLGASRRQNQIYRIRRCEVEHALMQRLEASSDSDRGRKLNVNSLTCTYHSTTFSILPAHFPIKLPEILVSAERWVHSADLEKTPAVVALKLTEIMR